ncbi:MAG TPA: glutathione S-transferase [Kofleriaceae bacterium]|nr:glutathione S-transferase [Kofleriaceae bacterium]
MTTKLITIPFSHYCEKARWALDRCGIAYEERGHLPLFHYLDSYRAARQRTVPILIDGDTLVKDSTDIIAWADAKRPGTLIPVAGAENVLAIEDDLDNHFGPHTRRWGYWYLLPNRAALEYIKVGVPRWEASLLGISRPLAAAFLRRGLNINAESVERSRKKIDATFDRIEQLLGDGRRYLAGDRFTVADLTFASLAAPVLVPPNHPFQTFDLDLFPAEAQDQVAAWRARPAGKLALRLYADDRAVLPKAA